MKDRWAIRTMCKVLEVSESGYYGWQRSVHTSSTRRVSDQRLLAETRAATKNVGNITLKRTALMLAAFTLSSSVTCADTIFDQPDDSFSGIVLLPAKSGLAMRQLSVVMALNRDKKSSCYVAVKTFPMTS